MEKFHWILCLLAGVEITCIVTPLFACLVYQLGLSKREVLYHVLLRLSISGYVCDSSPVHTNPVNYFLVFTRRWGVESTGNHIFFCWNAGCPFHGSCPLPGFLYSITFGSNFSWKRINGEHQINSTFILYSYMHA